MRLPAKQNLINAKLVKRFMRGRFMRRRIIKWKLLKRRLRRFAKRNLWIKTMAALLGVLLVVVIRTAAPDVLPPVGYPVDYDDTPEVYVYEEPANNRVTVTYAAWGDHTQLRRLEELAALFEAEQDEIAVQIVPIDRAHYAAALTMRAATGRLPDAALLDADAVLMWAAEGLLADMVDLYDDMPHGPPLDVLAFDYQGEIVAYAASKGVLLLFYNPDKFEAAGVDTPPLSAPNAWGWNTFVSAAQQLTLDANGSNALSPDFDPDNIVQYGVVLSPELWQLEVWARSSRSGWHDADGNVIIDDLAAMASLQQIADLHLVHRVSPQFGTNAATPIDTALLTGAAMAIDGHWAIGERLGPARLHSGLRYGVGVLPSMGNAVTLGTGAANVVFSTSAHPEAAMAWLAWYARSENSWQPIERGIRMPIFEQFYEDEALMRRWADHPHFPPFDAYRSAVIAYAAARALPASWHRLPNARAFNDTLADILLPAWRGDATVEALILPNIEVLRAASRGARQ